MRDDHSGAAGPSHWDELALLDGQIPNGATGYCEFDTCENELGEDGGTVILVSYSTIEVHKRRACYCCAEVYNTGVQHGTLRAVRQLREEVKRTDEEGMTGVDVLEDAIGVVEGYTPDPAEATATWEHETEDEESGDED
ncbi:MAG: hypothetical protein ACYC63_07820 [Armatimonadota bacterium]